MRHLFAMSLTLLCCSHRNGPTDTTHAATRHAQVAGDSAGLSAPVRPSNFRAPRLDWSPPDVEDEAEGFNTLTLRALHREDRGGARDACGAMHSGTCHGAERWAIKTGADAEGGAASVALDHPRRTTIEALSALVPSRGQTGALLSCERDAPVEKTYYELRDVVLVGVRSERDCDLHLVLSDGEHTMVAELPSPAMVAESSPWRGRIARVRAAFEERFGHGRHDGLSCAVSVRGVGFFDRLHGQTGMGPHGLELHPVLGIRFGEGCD